PAHSSAPSPRRRGGRQDRHHGRPHQRRRHRHAARWAAPRTRHSRQGLEPTRARARSGHRRDRARPGRRLREPDATVSWRALADLVVLAHFAFVLFVVLGGLLVLRWPVLAWVHLPAAIWGVWIEFRGWICPLTPLENRF